MNHHHIDIEHQSGATLRVTPIADHTFRIRLIESGEASEPALVRYGILHAEPQKTDFEVTRQGEETRIETPSALLTVASPSGAISLSKSDRTELLRTVEPMSFSESDGFRAAFRLDDGIKLYGLGDVTRDRIEKRGYLADMWVKNVASYVPIPSLITTAGWGLFVNTTWRHYIDVGNTAADVLAFGARRGNLDFFLFVGEDLPTLLDRSTNVTGKPALLPVHGYGLTFVCNQQADAREMIDDCLQMRREAIPCDVIGLEPGWMEEYYDYSTEKKWHPERFYVPPWAPIGPQTFAGTVDRLGFKLSLWLCCDYDLSYEEERRAGTDIAPSGEEDGPRHPDDYEQDSNIGHEATLIDKLTRPEEPWFEHLKAFVDQGASAFKMDGALQVNAHPDRKWGNGMDDLEMHNLYPTILNKQMSFGFREHTGRRSMVYSSGGYAGIQRYAATWAGDTGGGPKPLVSMLNHALSGHVNTSCDMDVFTPEGIHFGFLLPWSQVCSWAYWRHPWLLGDTLGPIFTYYADWRYRRLPYIYSLAHHAARTGMPILRPMPLAFPEDPRSDDLIRQYMFGDAYLTGAFTETFHLPSGRWIDAWTGTVHDGPDDIEVSFPEARGGPLFIRPGAIIPKWPLMQYIGQKPVDEITIEIHPGGRSEFLLVEDDGLSLEYETGVTADTRIVCAETGNNVSVTIHPRQGRYDGMPEQRSFVVELHLGAQPSSVTVNGVQEKDGNLEWDADSRVLTVHGAEDAKRRDPVVIEVATE